MSSAAATAIFAGGVPSQRLERLVDRVDRRHEGLMALEADAHSSPRDRGSASRSHAAEDDRQVAPATASSSSRALTPTRKIASTPTAA